MSQAKKARNSCSREIMKQKELLVILRRIWVMTDSTEEDMTMLRWRSTLFQWGIISGNTRNWRRESRKQKKTRWNRSRRCSDCLSADKIFLGNGQVLFKCVWNMKRLFTMQWWITFLGLDIRKRAATLKVVVNTIYSLQPLFVLYFYSTPTINE